MTGDTRLRETLRVHRKWTGPTHLLANILQGGGHGVLWTGWRRKEKGVKMETDRTQTDEARAIGQHGPMGAGSGVLEGQKHGLRGRRVGTWCVSITHRPGTEAAQKTGCLCPAA